MYHIYTDSSLFPLTRQELIQKLFDGKLKPSVNIQKGLSGAWKKLNETPEWSLFYGSCDKPKHWILLKRQGERQSFRQKGPYSTMQIRRFLEIGVCESRDFVWKKGFKEWKRISLISNFDSHPSDTIGDILAQQNRRYTTKQARVVRYSPSKTFLDWSELQRNVQIF